MVSKQELILIGAFVRALIPADEFVKRWPDLSMYLNENATKEEINAIIESSRKELMKTDVVSVKRSELLTMYAHTIAIIGAQETNHRLPGVRSLVINLMDTDEMNSVMKLIESIEKQLVEKR